MHLLSLDKGKRYRTTILYNRELIQSKSVYCFLCRLKQLNTTAVLS